MDSFRRGVLLALRFRSAQSVTTASIRSEFGVSVATAKRDRRTLLELADDMSLLDALTPATPPTPTNARAVSPLQDQEKRRRAVEPMFVEPVARAVVEKAVTPVPPEILALNNKSASLRALLRDNPDGLDYEQLSRHTGIARDRISGHVTNLVTAGDAKKYQRPDGTLYFKFSGDPVRVGSRFPEQQPSAKPTAEPPKGLSEYNAQSAPKTVTPPTGQRVSPQADTRTASVAAPKAVAPQVAQSAGAGSGVAEADSPKVESAMGVKDTCLARPADAAAPADRKRREQLDFATEMAILTAAVLAVEVRELIAAAALEGDDGLVRALRNFERADALREQTKAVRA